MAKKDKFNEVKIRLVMKLRKVSRREAEAEIARMDAAREAERKNATSEEDVLGGVDFAGALAAKHDSDFMTAEEFFGEA